MGEKMHLIIAAVIVACAISVSGENSYEQRYADKFLDEEETSNLTLYSDYQPAPQAAIPDKIYAGPLKATDEDEVIVVSRDNVHQLVKTLMLAYTHSEDPTMTQLLKTSGLGALKTTFKYLGKEDFGDTFLKRAEAIIEELNLEDGEEELLGEFAEKYLERHKFKIVVPESFLLHEEEMVEFLTMKKKMSRKKGRSMNFDDVEETTESLELYSIMPYTGRQFSTSIIPGMDLTWIALLGGMLAIPYYFWSDDAETATTSRKDDMSGPQLPNLLPPQFPPGLGVNDIANGGNYKRSRRPNGGRKRHTGPQRNKPSKDLNYRNWYNNHYFQQFQQHPPSIMTNSIFPPALSLPPTGILPPPGQMNFLPPVHPLAQASGFNGFNHHMVGPNQAFTASKQAPIDRNFVPGSTTFDINGLLPPPESLDDPNRIDTESPQEEGEVESAIVEQEEDNVAVESDIKPVVTKELPQLPTQFDHTLPRPNSILKSNDDLQKEFSKEIAPGQLSVPGLRANNNQYAQNFIRPNVGPALQNNPAPFRPTHFQNQGGLAVPNPGHNQIFGLAPPHLGGHIHPGHPLHVSPGPSIAQLRVNPGLQWRHRHQLGNPISGHPLFRGALPHPARQRFIPQGFPNALSNFNGIRGVPHGLPNSMLTTPLVPPPLREQQLGNGENKNTFGSFRPEREGSSHFKVSFTKAQKNAAAQQAAKNEKEISEDSNVDETIGAPTIVFAHPNDVLQIEGVREAILDLSKNAWQAPAAGIRPHQIRVIQPQHPDLQFQVPQQPQAFQQQSLEQSTQAAVETETLIRQSIEHDERQNEQKIQQQLHLLQLQRQYEMDKQFQLQEQQAQELRKRAEQQQQQAIIEQQQQVIIEQQQQQQQQQQFIQRQQLEQKLKQQQQQQLQKTQQQYNPRPMGIFLHADDGFIPIHGPPAVPSLLRQKEKHEIPKPSAFLDKLLAEQKERETSIEITYAKPVKLVNLQDKKKEIIKSKKTPSSYEVRSATPAPTTSTTTPRSSLFVRTQTARTGIPKQKRNPSVRVVTSTSVVTSRPIPLGKNPPKFYEFNPESREHAVEKHIVTGVAIEDDFHNNATDSVNEIEDLPLASASTDKNYSSLEEIMPNYENEYREVLREYQRKQLDVQDQHQVYDQVVAASEQLDAVPAESTNVVLVQKAPGFVKTDKDEEHRDINRILKSRGSSEVKPIPAPVEVVIPAELSPVKTTKAKGKSVPMYALDPFYGPRLSRADAIFAQMNMDKEGCREQVVCNMYKNPDVYTPLSDFLSRQLTVTLEELQKPTVADERILRFFRYLQAARTGQDGGDCLEKYQECDQDTTRLSHKPIIDAFYKVSDLMKHDSF